MENGECGEPRGIIKNARCIFVMMSAKQQLLGRIFSMHSPSIRPALRKTNDAMIFNASYLYDHNKIWDVGHTIGKV